MMIQGEKKSQIGLSIFVTFTLNTHEKKKGKHMLLSYFLKGFCIGIIFGVPAGAIGALTIRRTLAYGFLAGFATGMGSSVADLLYASVGIFGLTIVSDFVEANQQIISLIGGLVIYALGIFIWKNNSIPKSEEESRKKLPACFFSSLALSLANPAMLLTFLAAFTIFKIGGTLDESAKGSLLFGILTGTICWWGGLTGIISLFRKKMTDQIYIWLNRILGILLFLLGTVAVINAFI